MAAERVVAGTHIMIGGMTEDMTDMKNMTTDTGTLSLFHFCNSGFVGKLDDKTDYSVCSNILYMYLLYVRALFP